MFENNLKNKVSIITGGAGFLGIQHAHALLDIGSKVILIDKDKKKLAQSRKYFKGEENLFVFQSDITNEKKTQKYS